MTQVLIVDDSALARHRAREPLEAAGFEPSEVENGAQALAAIDRAPPDAVVLNVDMPARDGFAVMEGLDERGLGLPVVVATARDDEDTARRLLEAGAHDYLPKDPLFELHVANAVRLGVELAEGPAPAIDGTRPVRALVLDDSPLVRRFVRQLLDAASLPIALEEAADADEARRTIERSDLDVLLVDHELPGTSGAAFLEQLRAEGIQTPAIGLSGTRDRSLAQRFLDAGAYGMWTKEHEPPLRLRTSVERLARWNRLRASPAP